MFFIPYDEWMSQTYSRIYSRSPALKKLDEALKEAEDIEADDEEVLKWFAYGLGPVSDSAKAAIEIEKARRADAVGQVSRAFTDWVQDHTRKGQEWRASTRNSSGAVTTLHNQIAYWTRTFPSTTEREAIEYMTASRNKSIPALFKGVEVVIQSDLLTKKDDASAMYKAVELVRNSRKLERIYQPPSGGGGASHGFMHTISTQTDRLVAEAFGGDLRSLIWDPTEHGLQAVLGHAIDSIKEEIAALAPGVGLGAASASLVFHTAKLVIQSIAADEMVDLIQRLGEGDSRAALERVRDWQLRTIAARAAKVARAGVNVGVHSAAIASCGIGIPAQLAVSIATAIVALAEVIGELGMQYKEKRKLTAYLNQDSLGRDIFAQSPLAAAYYLLNTPVSHIALQIVSFGAPAWRHDVELLVQNDSLKTVAEESARLIAAARYRIRRKGAAPFRERLEPALWERAKAKKRGGKLFVAKASSPGLSSVPG